MLRRSSVVSGPARRAAVSSVAPPLRFQEMRAGKSNSQNSPMIYTRLSLAEVSSVLASVAAEARTGFGRLDARQLNWRPTPTGWSVAQCLQHLLTANELMLRSAALALAKPLWTMWQRLPVLPRILGYSLIRSQSPTTKRKFRAPSKARPSSSEIGDDIVERFVAQHHRLTLWMESVDDHAAREAIMISPFIRFVTYSVLDGLRLIAAHDQRHLAQARRVIIGDGFPAR